MNEKRKLIGYKLKLLQKFEYFANYEKNGIQRKSFELTFISILKQNKLN